MLKTIAKVCGKCFVIEAGSLAIFVAVCNGLYITFDKLVQDEDKAWKKIMYTIIYCIGVFCSGRLISKQASNMIESIDVEEEAK